MFARVSSNRGGGGGEGGALNPHKQNIRKHVKHSEKSKLLANTLRE